MNEYGAGTPKLLVDCADPSRVGGVGLSFALLLTDSLIGSRVALANLYAVLPLVIRRPFDDYVGRRSFLGSSGFVIDRTRLSQRNCSNKMGIRRCKCLDFEILVYVFACGIVNFRLGAEFHN